MVSKEQFGVLRYVMIAIAVTHLIISFISTSILRGYFGSSNMNWLIIILTLIFFLLLIFIHPNHHCFIGIPLLVMSAYGIYTNIIFLINLQSENLLLVQLVLPWITFLFSIISSICLLIIFFKPKNYHLMDFIFVGISFLLSSPMRVISMISLRQLMIVDASYARIFLITNLLNSFTSMLQIVMIVLYVIEAKRLEEDITLSIHLDPEKKEMLHELQKLYKDGILSFNEYQDKKNRILSN